VNVVDAVRAEVEPVPVIVLTPPLVSATTNGPAERVQAPYVVAALPVVHVYEVVVNAVAVTVTVSAEPKPVTARDPAIDCSGKP
jgi:hypothetical protein